MLGSETTPAPGCWRRIWSRSKRLALALVASWRRLALLPAIAGADASRPGPNGGSCSRAGAHAEQPTPRRRSGPSRQFGSGETQVTSTTSPPALRHGPPPSARLVAGPHEDRLCARAITPAWTRSRISDLVAQHRLSSSRVATAAVQDRPAWSPDGTKIAYGSGRQDPRQGLRPGRRRADRTRGTSSTNGTLRNERPVWSPTGTPSTTTTRSTAGTRLRHRQEVPGRAGAARETHWSRASTNDWQPARFPGGSKLCFLRGGKDNTADIWTAHHRRRELRPRAVRLRRPHSQHLGQPELRLVAGRHRDRVHQGRVHAAARLAEEGRRYLAHRPRRRTSRASPGVFDGNGDWAANFRPQCQNSTLNVPVNGFLTVPLSCTDRDIGNPDNIDREIASPPIAASSARSTTMPTPSSTPPTPTSPAPTRSRSRAATGIRTRTPPRSP